MAFKKALRVQTTDVQVTIDKFFYSDFNNVDIQQHDDRAGSL